MSKVSVRRANGNTLEILSEEIRRFKIRFDEYDKICVKPNLCCYRGWETGDTTSPLLVEDLIKAINEYNNKTKIYIVESDTWAIDADLAFAMLGYKRLERKYENVKLVNLHRDELTKIDLNGYYFKDFNAPMTLLNTDFFITFPKLKVATVDVISCALKNQYGCNPDPRKERYHAHLSEVITDLNTIFKPDFCIVDGIIGMDVSGPGTGRPRRCDVLILGDNPVSVDSEFIRIAGLNKYKCRHLEFAAKAGLGERKGYERVGDDLKLDFLFSRWRNYMLRFNLFLERVRK